MTYLPDSADRSRSGPAFNLDALDLTDRILLGSCAAVWLAALGAGVAATVALVDLAHGSAGSGSDSGTPWVLYTVIAVSAVVIIAAVPLLLRARRAAVAEAAPESRPQTVTPQPPRPARVTEAPTEKFRAPKVVSEPSGPIARVLQRGSAADVAAIDRIWLRCAAGLGSAAGVATLLSALSTYLMAVDNDTIAWVLYGIAGAVTLGMAAIPLYSLRELRALLSS